MPNQWSAWTAANGGTMLIRRALANNPAALVNNQFYRVAAETLILTAAARQRQGFTEDMAERGVRGYILGGLYVQLEQSSRRCRTDQPDSRRAGRLDGRAQQA